MVKMTDNTIRFVHCSHTRYMELDRVSPPIYRKAEERVSYPSLCNDCWLVPSHLRLP